MYVDSLATGADVKKAALRDSQKHIQCLHLVSFLFVLGYRCMFYGRHIESLLCIDSHKTYSIECESYCSAVEVFFLDVW